MLQRLIDVVEMPKCHAFCVGLDAQERYDQEFLCNP